ncbi:MAG: Bug family tripartite tricarboxylate transporter substrate binding protein, partial [Vicinamibacterales bacterium]
YDPVKDFDGLTNTVEIPMVLLVGSKAPVKTVGELTEYLKAKPDAATYGTAGAGSTSHFAGELFASLTNLQLVHVPYKGNAQALADVIGGQVTMMFDQIGSAAASIRAGNVRALGVTTPTRSAAFPDIPTISESGIAAYSDVTFNGLVAPKGTPPAVLQKLHAAVKATLDDPATRKSFTDRGMDVRLSASPAAYTDFLKSETEKYARLVKERGLTPQ